MIHIRPESAGVEIGWGTGVSLSLNAKCVLLSSLPSLPLWQKLKANRLMKSAAYNGLEAEYFDL